MGDSSKDDSFFYESPADRLQLILAYPRYCFKQKKKDTSGDL